MRRRALRTGRFLHRVRPRRSNGTARKFDVAGPWDVSVELADASKPPPFLLRPDRDTSRNTCGPCEGTGMTRFVIDAPVAIDLAADGATIPPEHSLVAPTLLRSQALALVYESVRRGEIDERIGRKVLDDIRGLRIRLLGDRVTAGPRMANSRQAELAGHLPGRVHRTDPAAGGRAGHRGQETRRHGARIRRNRVPGRHPAAVE